MGTDPRARDGMMDETRGNSTDNCAVYATNCHVPRLALGAFLFLVLLLPVCFAAGLAPAAPLDQACPAVGVSTVQTGVVGQLQVTITAGATTQELRFGEPRPSS